MVALPAVNLLPLPEPLSFGKETLYEPPAVALHSLKFAAIRTGEPAAVFGAGPLGLLSVAALRLADASMSQSTAPPVATRSFNVWEPRAMRAGLWLRGFRHLMPGDRIRHAFDMLESFHVGAGKVIIEL